MKPSMFSTRHFLKVLKAVVGLETINVMDDMAFGNWAIGRLPNENVFQFAGAVWHPD